MKKHFRGPSRLSARLQELGIRVSPLLKSAGLPPDLLDQRRILVTTEELFALWRGIGLASPNPAIGLELATETKPEHFDPIVLAALSAGSFGEAMRQVARYKQLSCPEEIIHETDKDEWSIQFRWLLPNEAEPEVLTDVCFAWVLTIARHGTGTRMSPLHLEFVRPRVYAKTLERHFGCPILFRTARNAIAFRASDAAVSTQTFWVIRIGAKSGKLCQTFTRCSKPTNRQPGDLALPQWQMRQASILSFRELSPKQMIGWPSSHMAADLATKTSRL
jgi:hypothetical protein